MSQGYPYPPSHPNHRSTSSSTSSSSSSSSSRPRAHPSMDRASCSSSFSVPSLSSLPPNSRYNPICVDDDDDDSPPTLSHRPSPSNPHHQQAPPPRPPPVSSSSSSSAPRPPLTTTSRKRQRDSGFSIGQECTTAKSSSSSSVQSRKDGFVGEEDNERTKLNNDDGRSPSLSHAVGALALFSNRSTQEPQNHHVASRRSNETTPSSSSKSVHPASSSLSWTKLSMHQHQGRVDKGKGREEPRNISRMLPPPPPPSSSHPSKASSHSKRSLSDFFSTPSNPPPADDLPFHLSPRTSWTVTSSPSSSSQAPSASSAPAPAPPSSSSSSPHCDPTPSSASSSSQPSHNRPPSSTPAKTKQPPLSASKLPSLEVDGVEWIPDEMDLASDSPPPSSASRTSSSRLSKHPIEPAQPTHDGRSPAASARVRDEGNGIAVVLSLTGLLESMQIQEGRKDRDLKSWRSVSTPSPSLPLTEEREDQAPRGSSSSSSSLSLAASSSSTVQHDPKPQLPPASIPAVASSSSSSSLPKRPPSSILPAPIASSSTSLPFKVVLRPVAPFPFSLHRLPEKEVAAPSVPLPVVPPSPSINRKLAQPSTSNAVSVPSSNTLNRAAKRGVGRKAEVIDISDSDDDGTSKAQFNVRVLRSRRSLPQRKRVSPTLQRPALKAFQTEVDRRLAETSSAPVRFVNTYDDSVPAPFVYAEYRVHKSGGGPSAASSTVPEPCDCPHCGSRDDATLETWLTLQGDVRQKFLQGQDVEESGTCCPSPETCPYRLSRRARSFSLQVFLTDSKGWGLRSDVALPSRYYLGLYAGRLYDTKASQAIEDAKPDGSKSAYLWDLDQLDGAAEGEGLTVDAEYEGNFTRFFNHSCDPSVTAVTIIRRDLEGYENQKVPLIGFVTNRAIPAGEELTLNYRGRAEFEPEDVAGWKTVCRCGAWNCLGRLNL